MRRQAGPPSAATGSPTAPGQMSDAARFLQSMKDPEIIAHLGTVGEPVARDGGPLVAAWLTAGDERQKEQELRVSRAWKSCSNEITNIRD